MNDLGMHVLRLEAIRHEAIQRDDAGGTAEAPVLNEGKRALGDATGLEPACGDGFIGI